MTENPADELHNELETVLRLSTPTERALYRDWARYKAELVLARPVVDAARRLVGSMYGSSANHSIDAEEDLRSALADYDKGEPKPVPITDEMVKRARDAYLAFHNAREVEDRSFKGAIRAALDAALNGGE